MSAVVCILLFVPLLVKASAIGDRAEPINVCQTDNCKKSAQRILDYMESTVDPCDDFYRFSCGTFLGSSAIKDDERNISITQMRRKVEAQLLDILQAPIDPAENRAFQIMKNYTHLCMKYEMSDEREVVERRALLEAAGGWPVLGDWSGVGWSLQDTVVGLRAAGVDTDGLLDIYVDVDDRDHSRARLHIDQPAPLLSRDLEKTMRAAILVGADPITADRHLVDVMALDRELDQIRSVPVNHRDLPLLYNPHRLTQLADVVGWLDWHRLLSSVLPHHVSFAEDDTLIVRNLDYLRRLGDVLRRHDPQTIANYIMWNAAFSLTYFEKGAKPAMKRMPVDDDRSSTCLSYLDSSPRLSIAVNAAYARRNLQSSKQIFQGVHKMVDGIAYEMARNIDGLDWIDDQTKAEALHKVSKMKKYIGYPKEFENDTIIEGLFAGFTLDAENFTAAMMDLWSWERNNSFIRMEDPSDDDWRILGMFASMVNAMYMPRSNAMAIPAGIIQWPFYSPDVPDALNYGAIGMIIGHEISHGFDDQGSEYDSEGELRNWWKSSTKEMFDQKKKCFIYQYNGYKDNTTVINVNGTYTQGENIADNAGIKLAYRAYRALAAQRDTPEPTLPGLEQYSADQLFFMSMGNVWCTRAGRDALESMLLYDPHSPPEFRVNGVSSNMDVFGRAFHCERDDPMSRRAKCDLW